jgi:hypothetical protein
MSEESIIIEEEALPPSSDSAEETWTETIVVASQDVVDVLRRLAHEASVRRVILRTRSGRTLLDIPVFAGVFGVAFMGYLSFIPLILAFVTETSIVIERRLPNVVDEALLDEIVVHDAQPAGEADDLTRIKGIGPKAAEILAAAGIRTYAALAATPVERLQSLLDDAGSRYRVLDPADWPAQAAALMGG